MNKWRASIAIVLGLVVMVALMVVVMMKKANPSLPPSDDSCLANKLLDKTRCADGSGPTSNCINPGCLEGASCIINAFAGTPFMNQLIDTSSCKPIAPTTTSHDAGKAFQVCIDKYPCLNNFH